MSVISLVYNRVLMYVFVERIALICSTYVFVELRCIILTISYNLKPTLMTTYPHNSQHINLPTEGTTMAHNVSNLVY